MNAGQLRLDGSFNAMGSRVTSTIRCPEFSPALCGELQLPDHVREQGFTGLRWNLGASIGLGKGVQIGVSLPLEIKHFNVAHELLDGTPYDVPYTLLVGTTEPVFGLGDMRVTGRFARRASLGMPLLLDAAVGVALPTGRISPNPFDPALPANQRQHRQFGNGTVDPLLELGLVLSWKPVGVIVRGSTRLPLYANKHGYKGQFLLAGSAGIVATLPEPVMTVRLLALVDAAHAGAARWDGEKALNSGRDSIGLRLGAEWSITPKFVLRGQVLSTLIETLQGDQFPTSYGFNVGVSGVIDLKKDRH